jgi:hypothetical protein
MWRRRASAAVDLEVADGASHHVALDELLPAACGLPHRGGGEAVDLSQTGARSLMQDGEGVGREEPAVRAGAEESELHVLGGVVDEQWPIESRRSMRE